MKKLSNHIQCHYYHLINDVLNKNTNISCWASIFKYYLKDEKRYTTLNDLRKISDGKIYIEDFQRIETKKYQKLLIDIINEITECKFVSIKRKKYISFKLLDTYDQSLVLLNFIRNLWHNDEKNEYTINFFEALKSSKQEDPLAKLTEANKEATKVFASNKYANHSNCYVSSSLKIKTKEQLLAYKGTSTKAFLTT